MLRKGLAAGIESGESSFGEAVGTGFTPSVVRIHSYPSLSQSHSSSVFLIRGQSFFTIGINAQFEQENGGTSSYIIFGSGLAAEIEFSYGAGQTVNLLALRLQWFESTPTQVSYRGILQVLNPLGG
jgi:hypothetical protein